MSGAHDRRSFFRELLHGASRAARELSELRGAAEDEESFGLGPFDDASPSHDVLDALPAERLATTADLRELCGELDREAWADGAVALARPSIRLTPGGDGSCTLGGPSPAGHPELSLLARLSLAALPETELPRDGALLVLADLGDAPDETGGPTACAVLHVDEAPREPDGRPGLPLLAVTPSAELTLPLEPDWFEADSSELADWTDLRTRLAALQGTDLEDTSPDYHALHRLLGYPDTLVHPEILMPPDEGSPWRLLFQLSADEQLGVSFGAWERLFVWIREDDLGDRRFDRVQATIG